MDKPQAICELSCVPCGSALVNVPEKMLAGKTEGLCAHCGKAFDLPFYILAWYFAI